MLYQICRNTRGRDTNKEININNSLKFKRINKKERLTNSSLESKLTLIMTGYWLHFISCLEGRP